MIRSLGAQDAATAARPPDPGWRLRVLPVVNEGTLNPEDEVRPGMSKLSVTLRKMTAAFGREVWRSRATTAVMKRSLRSQIFLAPSPRGPCTGFGKKTMVLAREGMSRSGQHRTDHPSPRCATGLRDVPIVKEVGGKADVHPAVQGPLCGQV